MLNIPATLLAGVTSSCGWVGWRNVSMDRRYYL